MTTSSHDFKSRFSFNSQTQTELKYCTYCDTTIRGRSDKRFCNDACRYAYHNEINKEPFTLVNSINRKLKRNRKILQTLLLKSKSKLEISRDDLLNNGFNFRYFTHINKDKPDRVFQCCYDFGYQILKGTKIVVVQEICEI